MDGFTVSLLTDGTVLVQWETGSELTISGFNIYRSIDPDGARQKLNQAIITPQRPGQNWGAAYDFEDPDVAEGMTYYYWLEAIETGGEKSEFGPESITIPSNPFAYPHQIFLPVMNNQ